jgi:signal-transduction protein with cAMP-binding, CBS, and nucleotidyltransferase domain
MTTDNSVASIDRLRKFIPLQDLSDSQLQTLADAVEVERAQQDQLLIKIGSQENYSFLLMEGAVRLKAEDGRVMDLTSEHVSARSPIARIIPRKYDVISVTPVQYLLIDNDLLQDIVSEESSSFQGYQVGGKQEGEDSEFGNQILFRFLQDLNQDKLKLPSLPDVAVRMMSLNSMP